MKPCSRFPAEIYRDTVLSPLFKAAKRLFLSSMLEIDYAHVVMLAECGIVPLPVAAASLRALDELDREAILQAPYDGSVEDLFFLVEERLAELCGSASAGRIHTARSRNDLDLTMYRMVLRQQLLATLDASLALRSELLSLAEEHRGDPMPAYTHNQPAQPTTLGHYLMAFVEVFERDAERLEGAWPRVNLSPLGACAITTTGFPIDRARTAELLGFEGLQTNSYGAIAAIDYLTESCSVLLTAMLNLGRLAQDLLLFSTVEFGYLRLSDGYVQTSSIMPQKRNPVPLEHTRILASRAMSEAQAVLTSLHNTPFADMNDSEDPLQALVSLAFRDGIRGLTLLTGVLSEAQFDTARMRERAGESFLTVTELADTLVRLTGISFHQAHGIVAEAVSASMGTPDPERLVDEVLLRMQAPGASRPESPHGSPDGTLSSPLPARDPLLAALTVENFIAVRNLPGGPSPAALGVEIERARSRQAADRAWLASRRAGLASAAERLHQAAGKLAHPD